LIVGLYYPKPKFFFECFVFWLTTRAFSGFLDSWLPVLLTH
jgi:hypothetical protein